MMGVEVRAPKAIMSPDPFPAFNVAGAELQRLWAKPPFPSRDNSNVAWEPEPSFEEGEIEKQYNAVHDVWVNPTWGTGVDGQKGVVSTWATALGWDAPALSSIASIPERLKEGS